MPGKLYTWGYRNNYILGNNEPLDYPLTLTNNSGDWKYVTLSPFQTSPNTHTALSTYGLGIKNNGTLWHWGSGGSFEQGNGTTIFSQPTPTQIGSDNNWLMVSAGLSFCIGLKTDGTIWSWGSNGNGRTAAGTTSGSRTTPTQIGTDSNWKFITIGENSGFAIKTNGTLWSWGGNTYGQLGLGDTTQRLTPTQVGSDTNWEKISVNSTCTFFSNIATLAIKTDGTMWSWGSNANGKTALGITSGNTLTPTQVGSDNNWSEVVIGPSHGLAIKTNGTLWSWGSNTQGQLGLGDGTLRTSPNQVGTDTDWEKVLSLRYKSFAQKNGSLWQWGEGFSNINSSSTPVLFDINTDWDLQSYSNSNFSGIALRNNNIYGWGDNHSSQLGNAISSCNQIVELSANNYNSIAVGKSVGLATKSDGTLWSWGNNGSGQTAQETTLGFTITPTQIGSDNNWSVVKKSNNSNGGFEFCIALKTNGTLWSWGANTAGVTGLNLSSGNTLTPTQIGSDNNWQKISVGYNHSLAIKTDGTMWSWGSNSFGQLGLNDTTFRSIPNQIGSDNNWLAIACGENYSLAIKNNGTLWGWGSNLYGKNGLGLTSGTTLTPTQIGSSSDWQLIAAGERHSLAIKTNGTLWSWGENEYGKTGLNLSSGTTLTPTQVGTANDWQKIVAADEMNSFALGGGKIYGFGRNHLIQFKDNSVTDRRVPYQLDPDSDWLDIEASGETVFALKTAFVLPDNTVAPSVSGTAKVGQTLTTDDGTWTGTPTPTYSYQWQVSDDGSTGWADISGATNSTYIITSSEAGKYIRSKVTATNDAGAVDAFSAATAQITQNPTNTVQPVITGTKKVGQTLTTDDGSWQAFPSATYTYQWQVSDNGTSNWSNISGATSSTYNLTASEAGKYIRSRVTATNTEEAVSAVSVATTVINQDPTNTAVPVITGTAKVGETLTTDNGTWQSYPSATYAYQWQSSSTGSSWSNISGATSGSFTPATGEAGLLIRVKVTATNSQSSTDAFSSATSNVLENPAIDQVIISGLPAKVGNELTASASATAGYPAPSISYQWFREIEETFYQISGANTASYTPTSTDAGLILKVIATATNSEGQATSQEVTDETLWAPANTSIPTITHPNHLEVGETLTADPGDWTGYPDPVDIGFTYQWQVSDDGDTGWTNVSGETTDELYLDENFAEKYVRIKVTSTTTAGTTDAYSVTTGFISQDPEVIITPLISGIAEIDEVLTVDPGEWGGFPDPDFHYQWERSSNGSTNWQIIEDETTDQLTLTSSEVSFFIRCLVTGTNPVGSTTAASNVVGPVLQAPFLIDEPAISGNARMAQTLTLDIGEWGGYEDPTLDVDISWELSPDGINDWETIEGADQDSYLIPDDNDLFGYYIRALVDVSNSAGSLSEYSNILGPIDYRWTLPVFIEEPTIDGVNRVNSTLEVSFDFDGYPAPVAFIQWQRQEEGDAWENIAGEEGSTYLIQEIDLDYIIRAQVTLINDEGSTVAYSDPSEQIEPELIGPSVTTEPEITGSFEVSKKLTAYLGDYDGYPNPELAEDGLVWEYAADPDGPWRVLKEADQNIHWIPDEDFVGYYLRLSVTVENSTATLTTVSDHFGPVTPRLYVQPQVLPVTNARLISIHAQNGGNIGVEFDSEFTLDSNEQRNRLLWHGNSDAYLRFKTAIKYSGGQMDKIKETTVLIPKFIEVDQGTVLTIFYNKKTYTYRVADVTEINQDPAMAPMLKCVLIDPGFSDDPQFES